MQLFLSLPSQGTSYNHSASSYLLTCNKTLLDGHNGNLQSWGTVWCLGMWMIIIFIYLWPWSQTYPKIHHQRDYLLLSCLEISIATKSTFDTWSVLKWSSCTVLYLSLIFYQGWYCLGVQLLSWMSQGEKFFSCFQSSCWEDSSNSIEVEWLRIFC